MCGREWGSGTPIPFGEFVFVVKLWENSTSHLKWTLPVLFSFSHEVCGGLRELKQIFCNSLHL